MWFLYLKIFGRGLQAKKTSIQCVFYVLCKITEKLVQDKLAGLIKKCGSFKISSMVSRFPVQL